MWRFSMNIPGILFWLFLASCSTQEHVRQSGPTRIELIQRNYQYLATCVTQKIDASGVAKKTDVSFNEQQKQIRVYEPFGFVQNAKTFEFLFIYQKDNQTIVKSYGFETLVGRDHYPNQIWPFVMECAGLKDP